MAGLGRPLVMTRIFNIPPAWGNGEGFNSWHRAIILTSWNAGATEVQFSTGNQLESWMCIVEEGVWKDSRVLVFFFGFWPYLWQAEPPRPGTEPTLQQ